MTDEDALAIAAGLQTGIVSPGGFKAPGAAGLYAWWVLRDRLEDARPPIPLVHPPLVKESWSLLYVGIGPKRPASTRTLADRVSKDHGGNSIGSSTFRQSLAALLLNQLGLKPKAGYDRSRLEDESSLTRWIEQNCGISAVATKHPWDWERAVIRKLNPPFNLRPGFHSFRYEVDRARKFLRRACGLPS